MGRTANPLPCYLVCLFMLESHECSSWESASEKNTGRSEVRAILSSLFLGSASHAARPGKRLCRSSSSPGDQGSGPQGWGGAARGPSTHRIAQNGSTISKQYRSLTREGWGSSGAANGRSGDTKEPWRNFFSPSRRRGAGTAPRGPPGERGSAAQRGRAPAPGSQPPPRLWREPFPRVSKKCQVLRCPHPASEPSSPPPLLLRLPASPAATLPGRPQRLFSRGGGGGGGSGWRGSGRPDSRLLLRDRSHDTGKLRQDGSRYPARLCCSGAHPPPATPPASSPALLPPTPLRAGLPRSPPSLPPQPTAGAFGGTASPRTRRRGGGGRSVAGGRGRGSPRGARHLGLGLPRPRGAPGPPPALAGSFVLFAPTTCLSSGPEGAQRKGRHSRRICPSASEGRSGEREGSAPASPALPPSCPPSSLSSSVASTLGHDAAWYCFSPSLLGVCGVDAQRAQIPLGPYPHLICLEWGHGISCHD
ncbi:translation initiation factor IF-2-like [Lutra lutra]|uniref:translation initiation factor IF-2-like n=1 Tax=Lutra lutra TaxID=9657 RepID=UPI001FD099B8|nr:translation initiation factor IF-2-like [Lutra lutra]